MLFDTLADVRSTLEHFRRSFDQMFESFFGSAGYRGIGSDGTEWVFTPAVETGWTDEALNLRVILPGVTERDVNVSVQGNQLVIEGERKAPEGFGETRWTQLTYGKFRRTVDLPNGLDLDKVSCRLHDGVLDIQIPVTAAMKPRRIPISSGAELKAIAA